MSIKESLAKLSEGQNLNQLSIAYAIAKDGEVPARQDHYRSTVQKILNNPDGSRYESVRLLFQALGVDIKSAIAIAANQKLQEK